MSIYWDNAQYTGECLAQYMEYLKYSISLVSNNDNITIVVIIIIIFLKVIQRLSGRAGLRACLLHFLLKCSHFVGKDWGFWEKFLKASSLSWTTEGEMK